MCARYLFAGEGKIPSAAQNTSCQHPVTVGAAEMRWIKISTRTYLDIGSTYLDIGSKYWLSGCCINVTFCKVSGLFGGIFSSRYNLKGFFIRCSIPHPTQRSLNMYEVQYNQINVWGYGYGHCSKALSILQKTPHNI